MNQGNFGHLKIFNFDIFGFVSLWPFLQRPGLTFSSSEFAFLTEGQMKLYELLLNKQIKNTGCL